MGSAAIAIALLPLTAMVWLTNTTRPGEVRSGVVLDWWGDMGFLFHSPKFNSGYAYMGPIQMAPLREARFFSTAKTNSHDRKQKPTVSVFSCSTIFTASKVVYLSVSLYYYYYYDDDGDDDLICRFSSKI